MTESSRGLSITREDGPDILRCSVAGASISVRSWGDPSANTIVLLHGGAAHSGWWDHAVPFLADDVHVLAPDLAGHGDSDWRPSYSLDAWSDEVAALISEYASPRPVLVGHSMGGHVALVLAQRAGEALGGVITVDSELRGRHDRPRPRPWSNANATERTVHQDEATILSRFRTMPEECRASPDVLHHVARQSVVRHEGGWSWKFDRRFVDHTPLGMDDLTALRCPVQVVRGEHGLVDDAMATAAAARLQPSCPSPLPLTACVPAAGHHVPLEEPQELASIISTAAAAWSVQCPPLQPEDR